MDTSLIDPDVELMMMELLDVVDQPPSGLEDPPAAEEDSLPAEA